MFFHSSSYPFPLNIIDKVYMRMVMKLIEISALKCRAVDDKIYSDFDDEVGSVDDEEF